jgi:hypothetical protein
LIKTHLDHVSGNEADLALPASRRVVQDVVHADLGVLLGQGVQLLAHQNVLLVDVGEKQVDLGAVTGVAAADDSVDDLEHWGDTGTTSDHTEVADEVGRVDHVALGTLDLHGVADLERGQVARDVTGRVGLDEQVEVARSDVGGDGSV